MFIDGQISIGGASWRNFTKWKKSEKKSLAHNHDYTYNISRVELFEQESELSIEKKGELVTIEQSFEMLKDGWGRFREIDGGSSSRLGHGTSRDGISSLSYNCSRHLSRRKKNAN